MKLDEINDPTMKLRLDLSALRTRIEAQDEELKRLRMSILALQQTTAKLIRAIGPKA